MASSGAATVEQYLAELPEHRRKILDAYAEAEKKLDMGKSCVRFRKLEDLPLDLIGEALAAFPVSKLMGLNAASNAGR
ncbi:MAG: hypothetical protein HRF45_11620 [Fimbriimonadia bacterium]|jgi:hypothetical protein